MNWNRTTRPPVYQLAGLLAAAAVASTATALAVVYAVRRRHNSQRESSAPSQNRQDSTPTQPVVPEEAPIQPAVNVVTPATVPAHFSEDIVIPGLTVTGVEVEREDAENGRSPEGA